MGAVRGVLLSGVTADWSSHHPFKLTPATDDEPGKITGIIIINGAGRGTAINFNASPIIIPALNAEQVNYNIQR